MIVFDRRAGTLRFADDAVAHGIYSGHGDAFNDPSREAEKGVGPLPAGDYRIGTPHDGGHLGPFVMTLTQISGDAHDRSGFYMHGDFAGDADHQASEGCVIASLAWRRKTDEDADRLLRVA
jgi:hypothetical protein